MSKKHLDYDGLLYLWSGIKTYLEDYAKYDSNLVLGKENLSIGFETATVEADTTLTMIGEAVEAKNFSGNAYVWIGDDDFAMLYGKNGVDIQSEEQVEIVAKNYTAMRAETVSLIAEESGEEMASVTCGRDGTVNIEGRGVEITADLFLVNGKSVATQEYADTVSIANASTALSQAKDYTDGKFAEAKSYTDNKVAQATAYDTLLSGTIYKTATGTSNVVANIGTGWANKYNFLIIHGYINNAQYTTILANTCNRANVAFQNPYGPASSVYVTSITISTNGDVTFAVCGIVQNSSYTEKVNSTGYYISKIVGVKVK